MQILNDLFGFFINNAYADTGAASPGGSSFSFIIMMAVLILFMYLAMWRPQSRRAKEHRNLINSLAKGDEVVTAGGILGKVAKIADAYVILALTDHVEITVQKSSIVNALPKGTLKSIA